MTTVPCARAFSNTPEADQCHQNYWGAGGNVSSLELLSNVSKAKSLRNPLLFRRDRAHRLQQSQEKNNSRRCKLKKSRDRAHAPAIQHSQSVPVLQVQKIIASSRSQNLFNLTQPPLDEDLKIQEDDLVDTLPIETLPIENVLKKDEKDTDMDSDEWEDEDADLMTPRLVPMRLPISKADFANCIDNRIRLTKNKRLPTSMRKVRTKQNHGGSKKSNAKNLHRWKKCLSERAAYELGMIPHMKRRDLGAGKPDTTRNLPSNVALRQIISSKYVAEPLMARTGSGKRGEGNLCNLSLGNTRLAPILPCIADTSCSLDLSANRMSLGRSSILKDVSQFQQLHHLCLSSNIIGNGSAEGLVDIMSLPHIVSLVMQDCKIGSRQLRSIANVLKTRKKRHSSLQFLDLRGNKIGNFAANLLSGLLSYLLCGLQNLALDNNTITHVGLSSLIHALTEGNAGSNLQRLSISMNPLGSNPQSAIVMSSLLRECEELTDLDLSWTRMSILGDEFREVLSQSKTLLHLQLSHNSMLANECSLLSEALKSNHTLLGLHIQAGNCCTIDWQQQIVAAPSDSGLKLRTLATLSYEGHQLHDGSGLGSQNCWLCEGWSEVEFIWTPGKSGSGVRKHISLCLASESWKPHPMTHDIFSNTWKIYLVLPPKKHRYMFAVDDGYEFASNYPIMLSQLWPGADGKCSVNHVESTRRPFTTTLECTSAKPRLESGVANNEMNEEDAPEKPWTFMTSVFLPRHDKSHMYLKGIRKQAANHDLSNMKGKGTDPTLKGLSTLFSVETDQMSITSILEQHYDVLLDNFRTYTTMGKAVSPITSISKTQWRLFLRDCKLLKTIKNTDGIISTAEADIVYAAAKSNGTNHTDALERSPFCEAICRVIKYRQAMEQHDEARDSGEYVLQHIINHGKRMKSDIFRETHCYIPQVDHLLRCHMLELKSIHHKLSLSTDKYKNGFTMKRWIELCNTTFDVTANRKDEEVDEEEEAPKRPYSVVDLAEIFAHSCMMVAEDELVNTFSFSDFLEAICRYSHLMVKPTMSGIMTGVNKMLTNDHHYEDRTANSSWNRIRELTTQSQVFLEQQGRFVSIQNGALISKSVREQADKLSIEQQQNEQTNSTTKNDMTTKTEGKQEAAVEGEDENNGESKVVDQEMEDYYTSIKNTITQLCNRGRKSKSKKTIF